MFRVIKSKDGPGSPPRARISLLLNYHSDELRASERQDPTLHLMSTHHIAWKQAINEEGEDAVSHFLYPDGRFTELCELW